MKKWITSITILVGLIICSCVTCFAASTSEELYAAVTNARATEKYMETANAPFSNTSDNDHIDPSSGNVVISETELYLPGKNGLDITLKRQFNSMETDREYEYNFDNSMDAEEELMAFLYEDEDGDTVWISFATEEDMLAAQEFSYNEDTATRYYLENSSNTTRVYSYRRLDKTSDGTHITLVRPIQKRTGILVKANGSVFKTRWDVSNNVFYKKIKNHWYWNIPVGETTELRTIENSNDNGEYSFILYRLFDGTSEVTIKYWVDYLYSGMQVTNTGVDDVKNSTFDYNSRLLTEDDITFLRSKIGDDFVLRGCIILERGDGLRYYVNNAPTSGQIIGVADKYNNFINYSTPGEIIDTMNRRIIYSSSGVQMEDENGDLQYVVRYSTEVIDGETDSELNCNKTHKFIVERFKHLGDNTTDDVTVYDMKKVGRSTPDQSSAMYYYIIEKISYPTGAHREYAYDYVETYEPYFMNSSARIYKSRAISSIMYDNTDNNFQYHNIYDYTKPYEGYYSNNTQKSSHTFHVIKTQKSTTSSDDIETKYVYDYLGRLQSVNAGDDWPYPKSSYSYNGITAGAPVTTISNTKEIGVTSTTNHTYTSYFSGEYLTQTDIAGLSTKYTYDTSSNGYDLLLTTSYTPTDSNSVFKTVTNTLSEDKKSITETTVSDASGTKEKTEYEYNADGTVSKMRVYSDIANNVYTETEYTYVYNGDSSYSVTTSINDVKDADGANSHTVSTSVSYDRFGNIASATDAKGVRTEYTYDLSGRVLTEKLYTDDNILYSQKSYQYDVAENTVDITRENGRQEKQIFDSYGNLVSSQVNYDGGFKDVYTYTYDTFGRPVTSTEISQYNGDSVSEKYTTTNTYDDQNRVIQQTVKNNAGNVVYEVTVTYGSENGNTTTLARMTADDDYAVAGYKSVYDAYGRKLSDIILNNTTEYSRTDYTYDLFGNLLTSKDDKARESGASYSVQYSYDYAGRVLTEQDVFGNITTSNIYNNAGLLVEQNTSGQTLLYNYDALGRIVLTHDGTGYTRNYYDDNGNLIKEITSDSPTSTSGKYINYTYDDFNRLTKKLKGTGTNVSSTSGVCEVYTYDIMGNVLSASQRSNGIPKTTYTYDILGRNTSVSVPNIGTESYTYNFDGTLKSKTDKNGTVFTYSYYDVFKNVGRIDASNGTTSQYQTFTYDKMNNLVYEYDSLFDTSAFYDYDFLGRQIESYENQYAVLSYTYDSVGNRTSMSMGEWTPMGTIENYATQTYVYDNKHRMTSTSAFGKTTSFNYNTDDYLIGKTQGTIELQRNYNNRGMVTSEIYGKEFGYTSEYYYYAKGYQYDCFGEQIRETVSSIDGFTDFDFDISYTYDGASRLIDATFGDNAADKTIAKYFEYDRNSNISEVYIENQNTDSYSYIMYPYTSTNHISGILTLYDGTNDTYKTVESDSNGNRIRDQGALYTYDLFNRLTSYTKDNVTTTYTYYPNGLRESKTTNNITTQFIWDGGNLVAEKAPDSYICDVYYIYGADGLAYRKDKNGSIYQYLVNFRGDVIAVLDENLNIKAEYIFDPYGEIYESNVAEGFTNNFGYRGQYHDVESGYIYLRMRYMDPSTGRFITEDPIRDGLNWFAYCEGNPIKYVDLWGLWMDGDENLSPAAQLYTKYYGDKWIEANNNYESATDAESKAVYQTEMNHWHEMADDIRAKDANGGVTGVVHNVQLFDQWDLNLCWAYSQVMIEDWKTGSKMSQKDADIRAEAIAVSVHGSGRDINGNYKWNQGWFPTNTRDVINNEPNYISITSFDMLKTYLSISPVYASYTNVPKNMTLSQKLEMNIIPSSHMIVITGAVSAPGHIDLVTSNNPWGQRNIQSFDEFINGIPGDTSNPIMKFRGILRP